MCVRGQDIRGVRAFGSWTERLDCPDCPRERSSLGAVGGHGRESTGGGKNKSGHLLLLL
jgi:hypothetical protein